MKRPPAMTKLDRHILRQCFGVMIFVAAGTVLPTCFRQHGNTHNEIKTFSSVNYLTPF
jgi:hypothetical protein